MKSEQLYHITVMAVCIVIASFSVTIFVALVNHWNTLVRLKPRARLQNYNLDSRSHRDPEWGSRNHDSGLTFDGRTWI